MEIKERRKHMKQELQGKVVVLTGAGGGIGRATAERLAKEKMKVALLGGNNLQKLETTKQIVEEYTECLALPGNLMDVAFLREGVEKIKEHFGGIDVLINNAGTALNCSVEDMTEEQYDKIMNTNVKTPYFLTQAALPYLKRSESATVINISSASGRAGYAYQTAYVASKHAVLGFTRSLAKEYYKEGIRVHALCPGSVYTDMIKIARPDLTSEGMILPEDIADIIYFFLSNRGNAIIDEIDVHRVSKEPFC